MIHRTNQHIDTKLGFHEEDLLKSKIGVCGASQTQQEHLVHLEV